MIKIIFQNIVNFINLERFYFDINDINNKNNKYKI